MHVVVGWLSVYVAAFAVCIGVGQGAGYLGTRQPASTVISLNSNTQSNVDVESHHGNIVALNSYLLFAPIPNI